MTASDTMSADIRILLVDDEEIIRKTMREMLSTFEQVILEAEAKNVDMAKQLLAEHKIDVIISDIQMEGKSGFELAKAVHEEYPDILFVFLTGHTYFAVEGYEYGPIDFLVKPVTRKRLEQTLSRARERLNERNDIPRQIHVGIQLEDGYRIFNVGDIAYIEKENRKIKIISKDGTIAMSHKAMAELEEMFADYDFFRCHQSYIVPIEEIKEIRQEAFGRAYKIQLKNCAEELPLSRRKYYELKEILVERGMFFC